MNYSFKKQFTLVNKKAILNKAQLFHPARLSLGPLPFFYQCFIKIPFPIRQNAQKRNPCTQTVNWAMV